MAKERTTIFVCTNCGNEFQKWMGECSACGEWNTLKEAPKTKTTVGGKVIVSRSRGVTGQVEVINLAKLALVNEKNANIISSNIGEFDRVLGKGIVQGSVILFAGEPGIGKSTILTQIIGKIGGLYVAGEESASQIALRVERLGLPKENFEVLETNNIEEVQTVLERTNKLYNIVVIDSIQTMMSPEVSGSGGGVNQIRETTFRLVQLAKKFGVAMVIVGHVTKEGEIAGPKLLEHMVDTVLYFEGDKGGEYRMVRVNKNRFGPTDEVGVFKMTENGLVEVSSEEMSLIDSEGVRVPGKIISLVMEGNRVVVIEIQALVVESYSAMPKRVFSGIDFNRGQLMVAIAQKYLGLPLYKCDVYLSVSGGIRITDTAADLAIIGAMYSSYEEKVMENKLMVGEVTLLGQVKKVKGWERRTKEARAIGREMIAVNNVGELKKLIEHKK